MTEVSNSAAGARLDDQKSYNTFARGKCGRSADPLPREANKRDIPEETVDLAESLLYAVEKLQETFDMIYAEAAITGGVEELNEIMQWKKEITGEEPEGLAGPEEK